MTEPTLKAMHLTLAAIHQVLDGGPGPLPTRPRVVCAWCGKVMQRGPSTDVSHGICVECERKVAP